MPVNDRLVRLLPAAGTVLVHQPGTPTPYAVPQFPMSQLLWLDDLSTTFLQKQGRCLAVALMLDHGRRAWGRPELPTQLCGREGVRWTWQDGDFDGRPGHMLLAGSYQSAVLRDLSEAYALVPPVDGVHLVGVKAPTPGIHAFVHAGGQTFAIEAEAFVINDVQHALNANTDRLTLD